MHKDADFIALNIAVLTLSDSRTFETDTSGQFLVDALQAAGHHIAARELCKDDIYTSRAVVSAWIADPKIDVVITTGGIHGKITGLTDTIVTLEIAPNVRIKVSRGQIAGMSDVYKRGEEKAD